MKLERQTVGHGLPIEALFGYSGALCVGSVIHIAGQLARDTTGQQVPGTLVTKLNAAYDNIERLLDKFNLSLDSIIQVQIHADIALPNIIQIIQSISRQRIRLEKVSLTVIQVVGLNDEGAMVEISAIARPIVAHEDYHVSSKIEPQSHSIENSFASRLGAADVVEHQDLLYVSGQLPINKDGQLVFAGDIVGQFGAALDRVDLVLQAVGSSISRVVALDIFTSAPLNSDCFNEFCAAHRERMTEYQPTGTMVRVAGLPMEGALVYISAIAAR